jgi:hypothetical protein
LVTVQHWKEGVTPSKLVKVLAYHRDDLPDERTGALLHHEEAPRLFRRTADAME